MEWIPRWDNLWMAFPSGFAPNYVPVFALERSNSALQFLIRAICVFAIPFFSLKTGDGGKFDFSELFQMVLDIVPGNFFTPFTEGNPMQIIFVAVLIGIAMLILGNKATIAAAFVEQSNYIIQLIMEAVSSFVPVFVFGSILNMILGNNFSAFLPAYKVEIGRASCRERV